MAHTDSSYAPFGVLPVTEDARRDKPQEIRDKEREQDRITRSALLKELRWDDDTFSAAHAYGFPAPLGRIIAALGVPGDFEPFYSRRQVAQWRTSFRAFAAKVR